MVLDGIAQPELCEEPSKSPVGHIPLAVSASRLNSPPFPKNSHSGPQAMPAPRAPLIEGLYPCAIFLRPGSIPRWRCTHVLRACFDWLSQTAAPQRQPL